jgi:hypothetical protein
MRPIPTKVMNRLRNNQDFYLAAKAHDPNVSAKSKLTLKELLNFWVGETSDLKFKDQDSTIVRDSSYGLISTSYNNEIAFYREISQMELAGVQKVIKKYSVNMLEGS